MKPRHEYLIANPFARKSVGDEQIWGETSENFYDVPSIHGDAFKELRSDLERLGYDHETRLRFVVGPTGSGKSHLFARLRRKLVDQHFTFVSVPPQDPSAIKRFVLKKVIEGLRHRARAGATVLNYSQLERFVYALLGLVGRFKRLSIQQIHNNWRQIQRIRYTELFEEFAECLHQIPSVNLSIPVTRVLFRTLDPEKRLLAVEWLSGSQSLTEHDHDSLKVGGPIEDNDIADVLKNLGKLGVQCGPIILVLDQLDAIKGEDCISEFQQIAFDLMDHSKCWYLVISLLVEKFELWCQTLSEAFVRRFGELEQGVWKHRVTELSLIDERQQREVISKRLTHPPLAALRLQEGKNDDLYPFVPADLNGLTSRGPTSPGAVLQDAEDQYRSIVLGSPAPKKKLDTFLADTLSEIHSSFSEDEPSIDTPSIADRITELFDVLHYSETGQGITPADGPLRQAGQKFVGSDTVYSVGARTVRVVCHDIQRAASFPNVLKKLGDAQPETILVRDGRVGISGKVTQSLLQQYRSRHEFIHLTLDEVRRLHALGQLLAKMRQGDFQNEQTEPSPAEDNIRKCLGSIDFISGMSLSYAFVEKLNPPPPPPPPPPEDILVTKVQQIMRREGWLCFERLLYRIYLEGIQHITSESLAQAMTHESLKDLLEIHPQNPNFPQANRILIWVED